MRIKSIAVYPKQVCITAKSQSGENVRNQARILRDFADNSSLYHSGSYYLSVKVDAVTLPKIMGRLCEHSDGIYIGDIVSTVLTEHITPIYKSGAIGKILKL